MVIYWSAEVVNHRLVCWTDLFFRVAGIVFEDGVLRMVSGKLDVMR